MPYDDERYRMIQHLHMGTNHAAQGSAKSARVEIDRKTMLTAVTIKDWNLQVIVGATCTSTGVTEITTESWDLALSKSLGGTGTVTPFGSAQVTSAADGAVIDASLTETNLVAGDDLIVSHEIGTALGDTGIKLEADVSYVEHFVG